MLKKDFRGKSFLIQREKFYFTGFNYTWTVPLYSTKFIYYWSSINFGCLKPPKPEINPLRFIFEKKGIFRWKKWPKSTKSKTKIKNKQNSYISRTVVFIDFLDIENNDLISKQKYLPLALQEKLENGSQILRKSTFLVNPITFLDFPDALQFWRKHQWKCCFCWSN